MKNEKDKEFEYNFLKICKYLKISVRENEGAIKNGQSIRETVNTGHTRHRMKTNNNKNTESQKDEQHGPH